MIDIYLTDEEINNLIQTPKKIVQLPSKEDKQERQFFRNEMRLLSADGKYGFKAYFRRHATFMENFSIGIVYSPSDLRGTVTLMRCNGTHGPTKQWEHHCTPHIHRPTEKDLFENRKTESDITATNAYNTYEQAVIFFIKECNIVDSCDYINRMKQLTILPLCIPKNS